MAAKNNSCCSSSSSSPTTKPMNTLRRKPTLRSFPVSETIIFIDHDEPEMKPPHFLDSCALCFKQLLPDSDIFMYKGNMPFCSEECRQEQIDLDEAMERSRKISKMNKSSNIQTIGGNCPGTAANSVHVRVNAALIV